MVGQSRRNLYRCMRSMTRAVRRVWDRMQCDIGCDSDCECQEHEEYTEEFDGTTIARSGYHEAASADDIWHEGYKLQRDPA
jgi:hypothetical protein